MINTEQLNREVVEAVVQENNKNGDRAKASTWDDFFLDDMDRAEALVTEDDFDPVDISEITGCRELYLAKNHRSERKQPAQEFPMKSSQIANIEKHRKEMIVSYIDAIGEAGGDSEMFLEDIDTMTVADMIDHLAQNGVRFCFDGAVK